MEKIILQKFEVIVKNVDVHVIKSMKTNVIPHLTNMLWGGNTEVDVIDSCGIAISDRVNNKIKHLHEKHPI